MKTFKNTLSLFLIFACFACTEKKTLGKFQEESSFGVYVNNYTYSLESSRKILFKYIEKEDCDYQPFPKEIVYAFDGGYLFVNGEFKLNIRLDGYYVNEYGEVSPMDLGVTVSDKEYYRLINKK